MIFVILGGLEKVVDLGGFFDDVSSLRTLCLCDRGMVASWVNIDCVIKKDKKRRENVS
jgi:hypothetical protein